MRRLSTLASIFALICVAIAIAAAFRVMGSPAEQRLRRLDERRSDDLVRLSYAIQLYWSRHQRLPVSLDDVERDQGADAAWRDPVTQQPYEYRVDGARAYSLCARFDRESRDDATQSLMRAHPAGRACFAHAPRDHDRDNDRNLGHDQIAR